MLPSTATIISLILLHTVSSPSTVDATVVLVRDQRRRVRGQSNGNSRSNVNLNNPKDIRGHHQRKLPDSRLLGIGNRLDDIMFPEDAIVMEGDKTRPPKQSKADKWTNGAGSGYKGTQIPKGSLNGISNGGQSSNGTGSEDNTEAESGNGNNDSNESVDTSDVNNADPSPTDEANTSDSVTEAETGQSTDSTQTEESAPSVPTDSGDSNSGSVDTIGENDGGSSIDAEELICLSIASQEPITSPTIEAQTTTESRSLLISVAYHTDVTFSDEIKYHLDSTNRAMAIHIAGCEEILDTTAIGHRAMRKKRGLQDEWSPIITYVELEPWSTGGPCDVDSNENISNNIAFVDELLSLQAPSESLCQQSFSSRVQVQVQTVNDARADVTSEYLQNQITSAFNAVLKPNLEAQPGIIGVELNQGFNQELETNGINSTQEEENQARSRRVAIIACSVVAACVFMCFLLVVLTRVYRRRQKWTYSKYVSARTGRVAHVPFEDEVDAFGDDVENETHDKNHELATDSANVVEPDSKPSDECDTDEDDYDYDNESDGGIPPPPHSVVEINPCPYEPKPSVGPFDEQTQYHYPGQTCSSPTCKHCEQQRQLGPIRKSRSSIIKSIESTEQPSIPMNRMPNTITPPRVERVPMALKSQRNYILEDLMDL